MSPREWEYYASIGCFISFYKLNKVYYENIWGFQSHFFRKDETPQIYRMGFRIRMSLHFLLVNKQESFASRIKCGRELDNQQGKENILNM